MRIGDPVAVSSVIARSWASSSARLASLRSDLIALYMCDAARFTVTWSGWSPGRWWRVCSTRRVVARSSGSIAGVLLGHRRSVRRRRGRWHRSGARVARSRVAHRAATSAAADPRVQAASTNPRLVPRRSSRWMDDRRSPGADRRRVLAPGPVPGVDRQDGPRVATRRSTGRCTCSPRRRCARTCTAAVDSSGGTRAARRASTAAGRACTARRSPSGTSREVADRAVPGTGKAT